MSSASSKAIVNVGQRRFFIGGSDARIVMGTDQAALLQLWREKRGEAEPEDLSGNLVVQLGQATEELNRRWYEAQSGQEIVDVQNTYATLAYSGWAQHSTDVSDQAERSSKASSCFRGHSRKKQL
jgi:predicted phage-related endonuclease